MRLDALKPIKTVRAQMPTTFPYIPGLLSFRELPVVRKALEQLPELPDLLMVDGQGVAHPRRLGIAAHLGVMLNWPAIGVAKSLLTGKYKEPGKRKGDQSLLLDKGEQIGTVLRSKDKTKPLFISPGHRVCQEAAVELTLQCLIKHRLPEPTRIADKISKDKAGRYEKTRVAIYAPSVRRSVPARCANREWRGIFHYSYRAPAHYRRPAPARRFPYLP